MRYAKFIVLLLLAGFGTWFANTNNPLGLEVPPLGKLLNPFTGFWQNGGAELTGEITLDDLPGLTAPVRIVYGERSVPHVFADRRDDALFAQGYLHAKHRWWQMNLASRAAEGRISEITGAGARDYDRRQRRMGMAFAAENAVRTWKEDADGYAMMEAYVAGVNAYATTERGRDRSLMFKLMDFEPEPWSVYRTALMVKNMAQTLAGRYNDVEASNALTSFGQETFDFLYPEWNPKQRPVIPEGTDWNYLESIEDTTQITRVLRPGSLSALPQRPDPGLGSNNWAVSGAKTASGNPILAGDPHLQLTLPSIWFELQMKTPTYNVYGVSVPGIPSILIGFNENIAWTETNVGHDVFDLYELDWTDASRTAYRWNGAVRPVTWRVEEIAVRGDDVVVDSVRYTHLGPVLSNDPESAYYGLVGRWVVHDAPVAREMMTFQLLNEAKDYGDYSEALENYVAPAQNFAFASTEGDVALKVNGRFPQRRNQEGRFVQKVSRDDDLYQEYIPMSDVPQVRNPDRGYISSANQHSTDPSYPYYYHGGFADYRGRIINGALDTMTNITVTDMMDLQQNNYGLMASEALPPLLARLRRIDLTPEQRGLIAILEDWNYRYQRDLVAPALFDEWWRQFYRLTWDEMYDADAPTLYVENWRTIDLLTDHPQMVFWDVQDTPERESLADVVTKSFQNMQAELADRLDDTDFNWGTYNNPRIAALSRIPAFGRANLPINGHKFSPNAMNGAVGPSWRMVVELGDEVRGYGVYPGGTSENPADDTYDLMVEPWARGEYFELEFMR